AKAATNAALFHNGSKPSMRPVKIKLANCDREILFDSNGFSTGDMEDSACAMSAWVGATGFACVTSLLAGRSAHRCCKKPTRKVNTTKRTPIPTTKCR